MHIRRATFLILVLPVLLAIVAAYVQWLIGGLPPVPTSSQGLFDAAYQQGFPLWIGITHYINFLFIILLIRSGLQILLDHPRLSQLRRHNIPRDIRFFPKPCFHRLLGGSCSPLPSGVDSLGGYCSSPSISSRAIR
jgi:hypothetical protein